MWKFFSFTASILNMLKLQEKKVGYQQFRRKVLAIIFNKPTTIFWCANLEHDSVMFYCIKYVQSKNKKIFLWSKNSLKEKQNLSIREIIDEC